MRNAMPMRWIEQAEARRVLASSLFELAATPPWCSRARDTAAQWLPRLGSWFAARHPLGWLLAQAQLAPIRPSVGRFEHRSGDGDEYRRCR